MDRLNTPLAILIGSLIISFAILVSSNVVQFKGLRMDLKGFKAASLTPTPFIEKASSETTSDRLKSLAAKLSLDQQKFNTCLDSGAQEGIVRADALAGENFGVNGTPAFSLNGKLLTGGAYPYSIFKKILDFEVLGGNWNNPPSELKFLVDGNENNGEISKIKGDDSVGTLPVLGKTEAPVTLVEFSDYECPFCERFYQDAETGIKKDYIDTDKIKFYFRDFPLTQIHAGAQKAAEAARCANDQGKFWQYHDLIFQNQTSIF